MKKILLVEDHFLTSTGLRILLNEIVEGAEIYESVSFKGAIQICTAQELDLIMLDIDIPGGTGSEMVKQFRSMQPDVKILVCTGFDETEYALEYIAAGASGFASKSSERHQMRLAVETVLNGKRYVSEKVHQQLLEGISQRRGEVRDSSKSTPLSVREEQILKLILEGKWRKEIASILNINPNTVSTYKARILEKMKVSSVLELAEKLPLKTN
ncbi:two component transcriptional regulator, LuxR family [Dyadobacter soli]|uniref:Two component transcriptional regulator, LuxR family n=1 Tax=Dyadobacter soli TaxID=659014 RepID=A0A1G7SJ87_9BACT|nr:response regulator transcription factor [Dyadobacter soli]SDG23058.1 two component transcriptional regulator, LuxR family [Dyadobacter soli]